MSRRTSTPRSLPRAAATHGKASGLRNEWAERNASSPVPVVSRAKGKRYMRKKGFLERIAALPDALISNWLEDLALLDRTPLGFPLGLALNALHALVRLSAWAPSFRWSRGAKLAGAAEAGSSGLGWGFALSLSLVGLSIVNAVHVVHQRREYEFWLRRDPLSSPNAKQISADLFAPKLSWSDWIWEYIRSSFFGPKPSELGQVLQLQIWQPDELFLRIFMLYSPVVSLLWHFMRTGSALPYLFAMLCTASQTFYLTRLFQRTLKDRLLLHAEVASEYQEKFVRPRLFAYKKDASTQTSQAEMIHAFDDLDNQEVSPRRRSSISQRRRTQLL